MLNTQFRSLVTLILPVAIAFLNFSLLTTGQEYKPPVYLQDLFKSDQVVTLTDTIFIGSEEVQELSLESHVYFTDSIFQRNYLVPITNVLSEPISNIQCKWDHVGLDGQKRSIMPGETCYVKMYNGITGRFLETLMSREIILTKRGFRLRWDHEKQTQPWVYVKCNILMVAHD
jgi:hypothetical protein